MWNLFDYQEKGFYLEVGAFDGIHLSNSYSFEVFGSNWGGICIEPHPTYFPQCKANRPKSTCLHVACVGSEEIKTIEFSMEELGLLSGVAVDRDDLRRRYAARNLDFHEPEMIQIQSRTINSILEEHGNDTPLDFVSIDVEGFELEVLKGFDLARFQPRAVILEANTKADKKELSSFMMASGYTLARTLRSNLIFVRTLEDAQKIASIRMKQLVLEETKHPLGDDYTIRPSHGLRHRLNRRIKALLGISD